MGSERNNETINHIRIASNNGLSTLEFVIFGGLGEHENSEEVQGCLELIVSFWSESLAEDGGGVLVKDTAVYLKNIVLKPRNIFKLIESFSDIVACRERCIFDLSSSEGREVSLEFGSKTQKIMSISQSNLRVVIRGNGLPDVRHEWVVDPTCLEVF